MKKNMMMRVASALLVAVLLSTCAISGTFAKYTTSDSDFESARVAKWGVTITLEVDNTAFNTTYANDGEQEKDSSANVIANTVASKNATDTVLAPGTAGKLLTYELTGAPEVAVNVKEDATLTLTGWEVSGVYYCPIVITITSTGEGTIASQTINGMDYASAAAFIADVDAALDRNINYAPNSDAVARTHTISWAWAFTGGTGSEYNQSDANDTKLGNLAVAPTIGFTFASTVDQLD